MHVVEKFQAVALERLARAIKDCDRFTRGLFIEGFVRYPRATHVFQTERFCLARDLLDVVAITFIGKMAADRLQSFGNELLLEFFPGDVISARKFYILEAEASGLIDRCRNIFGELFAQAIKLQSNRP